MTVTDRPVTPPRWTALTAVPEAPVRAVLYAALVGTVARLLHIRVAYPDGRIVGHPDTTAPVMRLNDPRAVHRRCAAAGPIGLGESYQAGEWDADDLPLLLTTMAQYLEPPRWLLWLRRHHGERMPVREDNSIDNARDNVQHHYDLSNAFFALHLDETMTYSSALFTEDTGGTPVAHRQLLAEAQRRKIDRVLDLAKVRAGTRLLEIGSGWGALAIAAARRGADVHTVTISPAQFSLAQQKITEAGVGDRVKIELRDYRSIDSLHPDGYDAIVSVEMLEAVGEAYWPSYFTTLQRHLATHGRIALQVITAPHERMLANRQSYTWIRKYIFPGGLIPSVRAIEETCRRHTDLRIRHIHGFGAHYAATLRVWSEQLSTHEPAVVSLGFDQTFLRTWGLYLAYSEAGFRSRLLDVHHLVLGRSA